MCFTGGVEYGLEFGSGVSSEGAVGFLVDDVVVSEFHGYIVCGLVGFFGGLVTCICVGDGYFGGAMFWGLCELNRVAPLSELDACVEGSCKVVGDDCDPHLLWIVRFYPYYYFNGNSGR